MQNSILQTAMLGCFAMLLQCTGVQKGKYFTGQLEYTYTYESDSLNIDSLASIKPGKSIFRYDLKDYQSRFIGKDTFTYFYSSMYNKCVSETGNLKDYTCEDYGILTDSVLSYKVYDTDEKISGHHCKILEFQTRYFWNRYYVSKDLKIAPATYQKHLAYNWSFYGEKAEGGLILKLEHRFKTYTMKGVVTKLISEKEGFSALEITDQTIKNVCSNN